MCLIGSYMRPCSPITHICPAAAAVPWQVDIYDQTWTPGILACPGPRTRYAVDKAINAQKATCTLAVYTVQSLGHSMMPSAGL